MSLLKQKIIKKRRVNNITLPESEKEIEVGNNKKYRVKATIDSVVYGKKANNQMLDLYYLISRKGYSKNESTWEPLIAVKHLQKLINTFHKKHL